MTDAERVEQLRAWLAPVIAWYKEIEVNVGDGDGQYDSSYLYDETVNQFDHLHHGIYQQIIEILK